LAWRFGDHLLRTLERDEEWPHPERSVNSRNDRHRERLTAYLKAELADRPDLIEKSLPDYPPYAKRILIDNEWFKTLKRDNVDLVTTAIARVTPQGVETTDGVLHPADVLVLATGFEAMRLLWPMDIRGVGGQSLHEVWGDEDASAYLGLTVPGFPNFFTLYGPNTNLAHGGSIILIAECQARYVMGALAGMLKDDIAAIECKPEAFAAYNARLDAAHAKLVWTSPVVNNWYRNKAGRVVSVMPWRLVDYWQETLAPQWDQFEQTRRAG
jgi:4-hydroxyacetophenone monooxygenase